ncbi:MAG: ABC transporter substrate-binding protein [Cephaloticoccus sp.]|nr:ABC transporter substrate-binding protein [Cephaloticoccus sp.]MCF7760986.1 ABC transporter substrate-binding protein [Cephaloticoccus sp.]
MKRFFLLLFLGLAAASALLKWTEPDRGSPVPVIYWITQDDPVKRETIARFGQWLRDNHLPLCEVRIDNVNQDPTKKLAQGLAGVGADLMDIYSTQTEQFALSGMLLDVTEDAQRMGFGPDKTYPALYSDLVVNGRQYGFPRNAGGSLVWINRDTFAQQGIEEPGYHWSWDDFERIGQQFVDATNPPGTRQRSYFIQALPPMILRRGLGLSIFNETMTKCTLDDPRNTEVMRRLKRWTTELHLIPTQAERTAMSAEAARASDGDFYLFATGRFATMYLPRWALIRLRPLGKLNMKVVTPPSSGFLNMEFGCGIIAGYTGSKHKEHVLRFQQFLTSEPFNLLVAESGDSLPPVPKYVHTDAFMRPPEHPEEWELAKVFTQAAPSIGIAICRSPFVPSDVITRSNTGIDSSMLELVLADRVTPEDAGRLVAQRIDQEIALNIEHDAELRAEYERLTAVQARIDALRAAGRKVPAALITNPFHLAYYRAQGWLEEAP